MRRRDFISEVFYSDLHARTGRGTATPMGELRWSTVRFTGARHARGVVSRPVRGGVMSFQSLVVEAVQIVSGDVPGVDMDGGDPADPVVPAGAGSKKGEDLVVLARIRRGGIVPPRDRLCQCCSSCSVTKAFSASRARAAAAAMASWVSKNMCVPSGCSFPFRGRNGKTHVQRGLRCRASA